MADSTPLQTDFTGGEIGPHVEGRVDAEKHNTGLEESVNYLNTILGPLVRRPGTKRVRSVKDPSKPPSFYTFKRSNKQQYVLEFGDYYLRFHTDNGTLVTSGTSYILEGYFNDIIKNPVFLSYLVSFPFSAARPNTNLKPYEFDNPTLPLNSTVISSGTILEIPTPYSFEQAKNLDVAQKQDFYIITHSSFPQQILERFSDTDWRLKQFRTIDGPYLPLNSYKTNGDSLDINWLVTPEVQPPSSYRIETRPLFNCSSLQDNGDGLIRVFLTDDYTLSEGTKVFINGVTGTVEANNASSNTAFGTTSWRVKVVASDVIDLLDSAFVNAYSGGGQVRPALFDIENKTDSLRNASFNYKGQRYYGHFERALSGGSSSGNPSLLSLHLDEVYDNDNVLVNFGSAIVTAWQVGLWNSSYGFPSTVCFHENRIVFAGSKDYGDEFATSNTDDYQRFAVSQASSLVVLDENSLQFKLTSDDLGIINWVRSGPRGLYFGTESPEFLVSPSRDGEALTPTNVNSDVIGFYGSADIRPTVIGDAIIYIQNSRQKARELRYFANQNNHQSTDITQLNDHIFYPEIEKLVTQKEFYPNVWGKKSDGNLISMGYSREGEMVRAGWVRHELGGKSDSENNPPKIKTLAVVRNSSGTSDQIWMAVERHINGTTDVIIEYIEAPYRHKDPSQKVRDAYYLDCGATYDSSIVLTNITQGSAFVTASNHGLVNSDRVLIDEVIGLNSSLLDINGFIVGSNLVNDKVFVVQSATTNNFFLTDINNSSILETLTYTPYSSGGKIRKLVSSISGLDWLKNEVVGVFADGGDHGEATVNSAGVLTLSYDAAVVHVGYQYKSRGKTLIKDSGSKTGTSIGSIRTNHRLAFKLRDVGSFKWGSAFNSLHNADFDEAMNTITDQASPLFTGIYRDGIEQDPDFYGQVCFEMDGPWPGMLQSITFYMGENDL